MIGPMCGRFTLTVSARVLGQLFDVPEPEGIVPRYNIAPTQQVLVARSAEGGRELTGVRWGLIPHWADDPSIGNRMINARGETVATKPAFRSAVKHRRCLIPADGFYEWQKAGAGKQPHLIRFADGRAFAFAGLWEGWRPRDGGVPVDSCTIVTTTPNRLVAALHDRMPVILPPAAFEEWLRPEPLPEPRLEELLAPYPDHEMEAFAVSRRVNSPAYDGPECAVPLP
ncbi:MAG TPA: SOS response-associated peptidase [Thermoanaerobaculales bacterium]|nr:SOS response-associated peptidase [Thermoanaerobaculales bacterium]